jgi:hypothetical protein
MNWLAIEVVHYSDALVLVMLLYERYSDRWQSCVTGLRR